MQKSNFARLKRSSPAGSRKKNFIVILFLLPSFSFAAGNADLFKLDEPAVRAMFKNLDATEKYMTDYGYGNISSGNYGMMPDTSLAKAEEHNPWGVPSFLWGCCLNFPGFLVVKKYEGGKKERNEAFLGCAANSCILYFGMVYLVNSNYNFHSVISLLVQ